MAKDKSQRNLALVVVDVQRKFFFVPHPSAEASRDMHLEGVATLVDMFHEAGRPVFFVVHDGPARGTCSGEEGMELLDGIPAGPDDIFVHKTHMNAFNGTDLAEMIRELGCDTALICGMYAEHCAMATYWGAWDNGLSPFMAKGGMIAFREEVLESVYAVCRTFDFDEVAENLSRAADERFH
ncbi:MAG: cysteine hydrolase [Candidatus Methanomethylophilaceae archaeon]|nr:cysteine hydrolase [Candidatus Methanomethylophilaceae archaeon]